MRISFLNLLLATAVANAAGPTIHSTRAGSGTVRGAALDPSAGVFFTWGDELRRWDAHTLKSEVLTSGHFGEGGCLADVNSDGKTDLVLYEGPGLGHLVWFEAPGWKRHVIDDEIEMHDCMSAELLGHRGILMVQRFMQLRFYEPTGSGWSHQDVYSFYTPSQQAGLLMTDIDGDGRNDIVCGNYWVRSPDRFDLPWRLYAINVIHDLPQSARFRLALTEPANGLVASQGEMPDAQLVYFRKPANPREQWPATRLDDDLHLANAHGLLTADLNADGRKDIVVGENNGARSRIFVFWNRGGNRFESELLVTGFPVLAIWKFGDQLLVVGPDGVAQIDVKR